MARENSSIRTLLWAGILLILATGLIHFIEAPDSFGDAIYKGLLFIANGVGAIVAAYGIYRRASWGWTLGLLVAGGALVAYVLSRTVGLPNLEAEPDKWFEPIGAASLVVEALFVLLALWVLAQGRRVLARATA